MKKALLIFLAVTALLSSVSIVSADQIDHYNYGYSDQYGVYETGEDGSPIYIWFWSEWARQLIMGDLTAPGTSVYERPADAPDGKFFLGYASDNEEANESIKQTAVPTNTPESTATGAPINTPKPTSTGAPTNTPKPTATGVPTNTPKPTATPTTTNTPTSTATPTATSTNTPESTATPTNTPTPTATEVPTNTPTPVYPNRSVSYDIGVNIRCSGSQDVTTKIFSSSLLSQVETEAGKLCKPKGSSITIASFQCFSSSATWDCSVRTGDTFNARSFGSCYCMECPSGYSYNKSKGVCLPDSN